MKKAFQILILVVTLCCFQGKLAKNSKAVFCYWGTWSHYRPGNGSFQVTDIDPNLCTHLGYAFFGLSDFDEIIALDPYLDYNLGNIEKTIALKRINPQLKVLAAIGGWNEGSKKYSAMASSWTRRAKFISSVLRFLLKHGFDGLDFDWEYPVQRGGNVADRENFVSLLRELNEALKPHKLLLTVAVGADESSATLSYDIPNFSRHVDFINLMTYDYSGAWSKIAGLNAPLEGAGNQNVKSTIQFWLRSGAPAHKILVGLPFYGRSFTLANSIQNTPGAPITGEGIGGIYTRQKGFLGYSEICEKLKESWTRRWDSTHLVPYAFSGNQWISYDDKESITVKTSYVNSLNLGGIMIWSIETDDFRGAVGETFPLLKTVNKILSKSTASTGKSNLKNSILKDDYAQECSSDGRFVDKTDCRRYYECKDGVRYDFSCPGVLFFDKNLNVCNWPNLVKCKQ